MKALNELFLLSTGKSTFIHECTNFYYKQLKSVHKVKSNYSKTVKLVKCHLHNICALYVQKRVKITLHSNIVTLQSKNKNNAFKAEVKFTKLN